MILLLAMLALLPTLLLMVFIYYKDSYEKEPVGLLAGLFFLGALSCVPAAVAEEVGDVIVTGIFDAGTTGYNFIYSFFVVALAEEGGKFIFTYILTWNNRNFNYKFDGIVYCVFASLGFATLENVLYVWVGGLSVAVVRAILAVPSHAIDAVFMGYFYGQAKHFDSMMRKGDRNKSLFLALCTAVALHGFYDFCLFQESDEYTVIFLIFVVVIDICAFIRINISSKQNILIYKQYSNYYGHGYAYQMYGMNGYAYNNAYNQGYMPYGNNMYNRGNMQTGYNNPYNRGNMQQSCNTTYNRGNMQQGYNNTYNRGNMQQGYNNSYNRGNMQQGYNNSYNQGYMPSGYNNAYYQRSMQTRQNAYNQGFMPYGNNMYNRGNMQSFNNTYNQGNVQSPDNTYYRKNMQSSYNEYSQPVRAIDRIAGQQVYVYCVKCGNICNAKMFYCEKCGSPIHTR